MNKQSDRFFYKFIRFESLLIFIIQLCILCGYSSNLISPQIYNNITNFEPLIESNTSIAFYIIATIKQKFNPDLRGNFWEPLLKKARFRYSLQYVSDGDFTVNGVDFKIYGNYSLNANHTLDDNMECKRVSASWIDFIERNSDKKWFFKGGHDTYVNVPELLKMISELEKKGDPMKTYNFAYSIHYYRNFPYPQGGAGFLASNYAMKQFVKHIKLFNYYCNRSFDDVALGYFIPKLNLSLKQYDTNRFVTTWPPQTYFMIKYNKTIKLKKCPKYYVIPKTENYTMLTTYATSSATIHFHHMPMEYGPPLLSKIPKHVGVYWKLGNRPQFCTFNKKKYLYLNQYL